MKLPSFKFTIPEDEEYYRNFQKVAITIVLLIILVLLGALIINDETNNFREAIYRSLSIITHISLDDVTSNVPLFFLFSIIGAVLNIYIIYTIINIIYEGKLKKAMREVRKMVKVSGLNDHYIICGGGRVGGNVAKELARQGHDVVVVERSPEKVQKLNEMGITTLELDALEKESLIEAGIERAKALVTCLGHDGENVLEIIVARELNPNVYIIARANFERFKKKLLQVGANKVIMPEVIGGIALAQEAERVNAPAR